MNSLMELIKSALEREKIEYAQIGDDGVEFAAAAYGLDVQMRIYADDEVELMAFIARFPNRVEKEQFEKVYPLLNDANNRGGFARLSMNPETGVIRSCIFTIARPGSLNEDDVMAYVSSTVREVHEYYKEILQSIYNCAAVE